MYDCQFGFILLLKPKTLFIKRKRYYCWHIQQRNRGFVCITPWKLSL